MRTTTDIRLEAGDTIEGGFTAPSGGLGGFCRLYLLNDLRLLRGVIYADPAEMEALRDACNLALRLVQEHAQAEELMARAAAVPAQEVAA